MFRMAVNSMISIVIIVLQLVKRFFKEILRFVENNNNIIFHSNCTLHSRGAMKSFFPRGVVISLFVGFLFVLFLIHVSLFQVYTCIQNKKIGMKMWKASCCLFHEDCSDNNLLFVLSSQLFFFLNSKTKIYQNIFIKAVPVNGIPKKCPVLLLQL